MATRRDKYPDLESLKRDMQLGTDYRIRVLDRNHTVTIISPHGGFIDIGTSGIAACMASTDFNFYDFQGLTNGFDLHVTSTRFRDAPLTALLQKSTVAVGVHSMGNTQSDTIWLGGLNAALKEITSANLQASGFAVETKSPKYRGEHPANVCNLPIAHGIQLELPKSLVEKMFATKVLFRVRGRHPKTTALLEELASAVRASLNQYLAQICQENFHTQCLKDPDEQNLCLALSA